MVTCFAKQVTPFHVPKSYDFGEVKVGDIVRFEMQAKNISQKAILLEKITASCGCTVVSYEKGTVASGATLKFQVKIDTAQKIGSFAKLITLYGKGYLPKKIIVKGLVKANPKFSTDFKKKMHALKNNSHIFKGSCIDCHVTPGVNKEGYELYQASCAACHGSVREGRVAPSLTLATLKERKMRVGDLYNHIIYGNESQSMPGFGKEKNGPLSRKQIHTLVEFLTSDIKVDHNKDLNLFGQGKQLYSQLCSTCHGEEMGGSIGPALTKEVFANYTTNELNKFLAEGKPGTLMSAYSKKHGGPLTDWQIKVLVSFLKRKR